MIKIGIESTNYFRLYDYRRGFEKMREHGYDCTDYSELSFNDSELYTFDDKKFAAFLTDVGRAAEGAGVEIFQLHALWPTEDKTEEGRAFAHERFKKEIEGAHYLSCKNVVVHPCLPYGWGSEGDKERVWQFNVERFESLLPYAEKYGVTVCVENLPFTAIGISTVAEVKRLVRTINHPLLKICLDTGHANVFHDDIAEDIRLIGSDLATLHIHDNKGNWDQHLLPYMGNIKWNEALAALKEIGYNGCFSLETLYLNKMPEPVGEEMYLSLAKLARMMAKDLG